MEQVAYQPEVEYKDRRTDDLLYNVHYLAARIVDRDSGQFLPTAENDVNEQNVTTIAESDVHKLAATVYQHRQTPEGQYVSLGMGTVDHARNGLEALDLDDPLNWFEYWRRDEELGEEVDILQPEYQEGMRAGGIKVFISPSPTHHEVDPDIANASFGYDDRAMVRLQRLSKDGQVKTMKSYTIFGVSAKVWAEFLEDSHEREIEPTALAVMKFSRNLPLETGSFETVIEQLLQGVASYLPEEERASLTAQLQAFLTEQEELAEQVDFYAHEKLEFQKELALSLGSWARPVILHRLNGIYGQLNSADQLELSKRVIDDGLYVDDYVAGLLIKVNTVTTDNRAGLATHNERTIKRVASSIGLEATLDLAAREQFIQQATANDQDPNFMIRRSEQQLAESGASCGGGCAFEIKNLFSEEAQVARKAGLAGKLYESKSLDEGSKCSCVKNHKAPKVISNGKSVVCVTCGDFKVKGKLGSLKRAA